MFKTGISNWFWYADYFFIFIPHHRKNLHPLIFCTLRGKEDNKKKYNFMFFVKSIERPAYTAETLATQQAPSLPEGGCRKIQDSEIAW